MMPDYHARNTSMSHLSPERLAALVDETPTAAELAHLAGCAECARERAAYRNLVELAVNNSATIATPLTSWRMMARRFCSLDSKSDSAASLDRRMRPQMSISQARLPWM